MERRKHTAEAFVAELRPVDVLVSQGRKVAKGIRSLDVSEAAYARWRFEYGGLNGDRVKRSRSPETEPHGFVGRSRTLPWRRRS